MRLYSPRIFFLFFAIVGFEATVYGASPTKLTRQQYIDQYAQMAIQEMNEYHIPASITMAQACLESGDGNSTLARLANNHFGIKCTSSWSGASIRKDDDRPNECFRKYDSAIESFRDHSRFLTGGMRYQFLFDYNIKDYKKWAYGLKRAGYATDPQYPERLLKIIDDFELHKLDEYYNSSAKYTKKLKYNNSNVSERRHRRGSIGNFAINPYMTRNVEKRNGAKAFFAKEGDTYEQIAAEFSMKEWELYKYNDVKKGARPEPGSIVYLESKRGSAPRGNDVHIMKSGESLWSVAQWYGVRLNALYRKNRMSHGQMPAVGQSISLREKVSRSR